MRARADAFLPKDAAMLAMDLFCGGFCNFFEGPRKSKGQCGIVRGYNIVQGKMRKKFYILFSFTFCTI